MQQTRFVGWYLSSGCASLGNISLIHVSRKVSRKGHTPCPPSMFQRRGILALFTTCAREITSDRAVSGAISQQVRGGGFKSPSIYHPCSTWEADVQVYLYWSKSIHIDLIVHEYNYSAPL